jgi:hypothetical protein
MRFHSVLAGTGEKTPPNKVFGKELKTANLPEMLSAR